MGYVPIPFLTPEEFHRAMDEIPKDIPRSVAAGIIARRGARVSRIDLRVVFYVAFIWLAAVVFWVVWSWR